MKASLKVKLVFSYIVLSLFLVITLLLMSHFASEKHFRSYVQKVQEKRNIDIATIVLNEFEKNGRPSAEFLYALGQESLNNGVILMVTDKFGDEIFCMSTIERVQSENMLEAMRETMHKRYPYWHGEYQENIYGLTKNGIHYGKITLGVYGPFYFNSYDIRFIDVYNQIVLVVAALSLLIAIAIGYYMAVRLTSPIKKVIDKTRDIERGNFTNRIDTIIGTTEIDRLIISVNNLAETLEYEQQAKKIMANDYAHEFRTPLTILQSNLEGMIDGIFNITPERLESCRQEIIRLSKMVTEIDKIAIMETDTPVLNKEIFDLNALVEMIALNFSNDLSVKKLDLSIMSKQCEIYADKDKISQVIINLLSNAVKYTNDGGKIKIAVKDNKDTVTICISDTGIGIAAADLPHIFGHLYRTDKSRARGTGGSGIGLSVTKAIVCAHGGTIEVKSEVSTGSEFIVTLKRDHEKPFLHTIYTQ